MASSSTRNIGIGTSILVVLAVAVGAATGSAGATGETAWQKGLRVRSEALNQKYGLGDGALGTSTVLGRHDALGRLGSTDRDQALELVGLRIDRGLRLSSAP